MVVKYLFSISCNCLFLSVLKAGLVRAASEKGHKIVSHREQRSVQKISWRHIGCGICFMFFFFFVLPCAFSFVGERVMVSPVAVALSLQLCTYPVLWQLYICESEERKYLSKIYIFCSLILFSLIVAWKIKVFGNIHTVILIHYLQKINKSRE